MNTILLLAVYSAALALSVLVLAVLVRLVWSALTTITQQVRTSRTKLLKQDQNPILEPHCTNVWETEAVFNPAALYIDSQVHILYRALGPDGASRIGYAQSEDGVCFHERLPYPVYSYAPDAAHIHSNSAHRYHPGLYKSGGGWGGCEDPRVVCIEDTVYLTFSAFNGWDSLRIGMISLPKEHFIRKWWDWSEVTYLSPPNEVHKNWVLFPEKINNQYALLTSITPTIQIAYANTPEAFAQQDLSRTFTQRADWGPWEGTVRGAGPPPLKTQDGWLVLYHANPTHDHGKYHLGALLLAIDDPTIILAQSKQPILSPTAWYENEGKPGVVYATGAIVKNDTLYVYYGGADRVVCVGTANLTTFLHDLMHEEYAQLHPQPLQSR